jgi:hypothetical protein
MRMLMRINIGLVCFLCFCLQVSQAKESTQLIGVRYLNINFSHIHQNPSRYSATLTTISCGHPVKLVKKITAESGEQIVFAGNWNMVEVGPYKGFLNNTFLQESRPKCFQDIYSQFFDAFPLEISDLFYWGKLYDMMEIGRSKVK